MTSCICVGLEEGLFFAGGPVWAMDWMPHPLPSDSYATYIVLVAHRSMDEVLIHAVLL